MSVGRLSRLGLEALCRPNLNMESLDLLVQTLDRPLNLKTRGDLLDAQRADGAPPHTVLVPPGAQLLRRGRVHDPPEPAPRVRRRAHGAVLPARVDGRRGALGRREVPLRPPGERELGVQGGVGPRGLAVAVRLEDVPRARDEDGAEGPVAGLEGLAGEGDGEAKVLDVLVVDHDVYEY